MSLQNNTINVVSVSDEKWEKKAAVSDGCKPALCQTRRLSCYSGHSYYDELRVLDLLSRNEGEEIAEMWTLYDAVYGIIVLNLKQK